MSAASVVVHEDAPNYARPKADCESKKDVTNRRREAAYFAWRRGDHHPDRAREVVESPGSGGSAASVAQGHDRSAFAASVWQQAAAEGAAAAAGTPPSRLVKPLAPEISDQLRYLRKRLREFLRESAARGIEVTMYDVGDGEFYPTEQWTVHFFTWMRARA